MVNHWGNRRTVASVGEHLVSVHGKPERQLGNSGSCYLFFRSQREGKVKVIDTVMTLLALYLAYVISRIASRDLRHLDIAQVIVSISGDGHQDLMKLVVVVLQSVSLYSCYKMHRERQDSTENYADVFFHMLLGRVCKTRLHDVTKEAATDPRYATFLRVFNVCTTLFDKAVTMSIWVNSRSKDLLELWGRVLDVDTFLADALFEPMQPPKRRKLSAAGVQNKKQTILWKSRMPNESRDILLNRTSSDPENDAYILRHVDTLIEMAGKRYDTVDAMVEKLSGCGDTGEFTLQHYGWNLLKVAWCEVVDMAPRTAFTAISKQNTLKVAQRILQDSELASPCRKAANVVFEQAADGYMRSSIWGRNE